MLPVFVPREDASLQETIEPGSGIVGSRREDGRVRIDYEGNLYGAANITTFADRVYHAASRHTAHEGRGYPTRARQVVERDELVQVGCFDEKLGIVRVERPLPLQRWLGTEEIEEAELFTTVLSHRRRRRGNSDG